MIQSLSRIPSKFSRFQKYSIGILFSLGIFTLAAMPSMASADGATAITGISGAVTSIGTMVTAAIPIAASVAIATIGLMIFKRIGMS